jgi:5-methylcytosine-specific restriction endonuclease McrA
MADAHQNFPAAMQKAALVRQNFRCASCGEHVAGIGNQGADVHVFGEGAEGHHVIPHKLGGPISIANCVILCRSCHMSAHQGGRYADVSIYKDLWRYSMANKIEMVARLYPHYGRH